MFRLSILIMVATGLFSFAATLPSAKKQASSRIQSIQWVEMSEAEAPTPRLFHSTVWTGNEMIVWGGIDAQGQPLASGGIYNPSTNRWRPLSRRNAPSARSEHSAVWTGEEMIVWGGCTNRYMEGPCVFTEGTKSDGGIYHLSTDTWTELPSGISEARAGHYAFWSGDSMLVFDGYQGMSPLFPGVWSFQPAKMQWMKSETELHGTPIQNRSNTTTVYAENRLYVWGGARDNGRANSIALPRSPKSVPSRRDIENLNDGLIYDVQSRSWESISNTDAPAADCWRAAASWTGKDLVVFGGSPDPRYDGGCNTGGIYNPSSRSWRQTPLEGAPSKRYSASVLAYGQEHIIWGGKFQRLFHEGETYGDAFALDTVENRWRTLTQSNAPKDRAYHSSVWTGDRLIVWGGYTVENENWEFLTSGAIGTLH